MNTVIRMPGSIWKAIEEEVRRYDPQETVMLLLARKILASEQRVYVASRLIIPDAHEAHRSRYQSELSPEFIGSFWPTFVQVNAQDEYSVIAVHSHPFDKGATALSPIDDNSLEVDYPAFRQSCGPNTDLVHVVVNKHLSHFDGVCMTAEGKWPVDRLVLLSNPLQVLSRQEAEKERTFPSMHARALLIPEFDLQTISPLRVGIVGPPEPHSNSRGF